ncbi:hypothetical protein EV421DRAFT_2039139 [Armillaria borealis]|uniref:C2H2-type domain-containing protein n=1 Tax=Armillaria borealis TaxID=47425 RepID=A0AA39J4L5_9AGAR|nr:hypothetical protein EV421DRAFT_2039139 [Armillaria borealis]
MPRAVSEKYKNRPRVVCDICGKDYADNTGLSRHRRHHKSKGYKCEYCNHHSFQKPNLAAHVRAWHTDERPYKCTAPGCNHAFANSGGLSRHRANKHTRPIPFIYTRPTPPPKQLLPAADAGTTLEEVDTIPSSPQSDSEAGFLEELTSTSTPSQSQSDINSDVQDMPVSPTPTPSPRANDLYLPEMVIPSTSSTNLLFVDTNDDITDPFILDAGLPGTSPPSPQLSSPFLSTSPVVNERLSPPLSFDSLNSSFRSWDNESYQGSSRLDCDITESLDLGSFASSSSSKNERRLPALSFDSDRSSISSSPFEQLLTPLLFETEQLPSKTSAFDMTFLNSEESLDAFQFPIF